MCRPDQPIAILLWLGALAFGPPAAAAIVDSNFRVEVISGPLAPQAVSRSFSFDGAVPPTPGIHGEDLYVLTGFSFLFDGATFELSDLDHGDATFAGGSFIGLDAGNATFPFLPAIAPRQPALLDDPALGTGDGNPAVSRVPEPAGGLLAAAATAGRTPAPAPAAAPPTTA